jgi:L-proline amide hydrolase
MRAVETTREEAAVSGHEGRMEWRGHETWYRVVGELDPDAPQTPVVICHGGPGAAHDYCEPIADLSRFGRTCVLYDQLGCGRSELLPQAPPDFWMPQLFKDELVELTRHLSIAGRYAVVGQSWGGMLAMEHALEHPAGLRGMVVADSPASMTLWISETGRLRADLPIDVQETLTRHEEAGTTDDPEYRDAVEVFNARHVCRVVPKPDCVERTSQQIRANPTVYETMNGPSEFHVVGSLKAWDITDRLHEIATPTLLVSGRHDEATPLIVGQIRERIPGAEWVIFEESSHMPHVEEPEAFLETVEGFLRAID